MYRKILVPIDGSEGSNQAVEHLLKILENEKPEKIMLFHAVSYPTQLESGV
ncbi:MAG: universal stress protein [Bacillota bacterium]